MKNGTIRTLAQTIRELEHVWITLSDGCRVAARIWLPEDSEQNPVPAILEYLPYRQRDGTRARDAMNHPYFAAHGYASVRVDIRGTGDSDGVMHDEYLKQEQDDALEILEWIAAQPWCSGNIGMIGISWGGFNGLQVAARNPKELKAVITICSTDDRYADDVHYMGGSLLTDNLSWASTMLAVNSRPPDPVTAGSDWLEKWQARLAETGFWLEPWLEHQTRDEYWKHGSVNEDFSAITCPVFAVGGWTDSYSNAIPRLLEGLESPRLGLIGPWGHQYPNMGVPGPAMGFLQEAVRWWDYWLKGVDSGIMDEPQLRAWVQDSVKPDVNYETRPGRWVGEPAWPSLNVGETVLPLAAGRLLPAGSEAAPAELSIHSPLSTGLDGGKWYPRGSMPDLPGDQRADDSGSLVFDSEVLTEPVEILGAPVVNLEFSSDRPVAMVAARLSDVAPDGSVTRVTYGLLNLTHRDSHEHPEALVPGERYRVQVQLNDVGQHFPAGHRVRLSLSTSYWPLAWTPPEPVTLTVLTGSSSLLLPVREPRASDSEVSVAMPPTNAPALVTRQLRPREHGRTITRDLGSGLTVVEVLADDGEEQIEEINLAVSRYSVERYTFSDADYSAVKGETIWESGFRRDDWHARTVVRTRLTSTVTHFQLYAELVAYHGEDRIYSNTWQKGIPRNLV